MTYNPAEAVVAVRAAHVLTTSVLVNCKNTFALVLTPLWISPMATYWGSYTWDILSWTKRSTARSLRRRSSCCSSPWSSCSQPGREASYRNRSWYKWNFISKQTFPNIDTVQYYVPELSAARADDFLLLQQLDFHGVLTAATRAPSHVLVVLDEGLGNHLVVLLAHFGVLDQLANRHFIDIDLAVLGGARNIYVTKNNWST